MSTFFLIRLLIASLLSILIISGCKKDNPSPDPVFDSLAEELDYLTEKYVKMGAAIGIIDLNQQQHEFYYGSLSSQNSNPPNAHSVFEIGSITKTFTTTLLADMILEGKIHLEDTVENLLTAGEVNIPSWNGKVINIEHLATHTSGLPKSPQASGYPLPPGFDSYNPYSVYTHEHIYEYLTSYCSLLYEPGTQYSYSNTGVGLIGHILGLADSTSYEELVAKEIFNALNMYETSLNLTDEQLTNLAHGHTDQIISAKNYTANDIFQGAGFIKSSLHDMLLYLNAQMGLVETSLRDAVDLALQPLFNVGQVTYDGREGVYNLSIGLGWHIEELTEGYTFHWHGGRTLGYMAYIGFNRSTTAGVVILCNQSSPGVITGFGGEVMKAIHKY